jgi:hypothetical protein
MFALYQFFQWRVAGREAMVAPFDAPASGADSTVEKNLSGLIGGEER